MQMQPDWSNSIIMFPNADYAEQKSVDPPGFNSGEDGPLPSISWIAKYIYSRIVFSSY